jgi:hypothetical protein
LLHLLALQRGSHTFLNKGGGKSAAHCVQIACKMRAFFVQISCKSAANCVQIACKSAANQTKNVILTAKGVTRKKPKVLTCSRWIKFHFLLIT